MTGSIVVTAEDGYTTETYEWKIVDGRELCTNTALSVYSPKDYIRTFAVEMVDGRVKVSLKGNQDVTVEQLKNALFVNDGTAQNPEPCTHATIEIKNSTLDKPADLSANLVAGQTDLVVVVTPEKGVPTLYYVDVAE